MYNKTIQNILFEYQDQEYKNFHSKLMPTVCSDLIIGVRVPQIRKIAKEIKNSELANKFIKILPHKYYEENNLHAFLIEQITDYDKCIEEIQKFLPYVDNWATCDMLRPKCFKNHTEELYEKICEWITSNHTYTIRYAIEMLMIYFLDNKFKSSYLEVVAGVKSDEYYVNMMIAWYFATALAKQYSYAITYITENRLSVWIHNKTIQKAVESYRISDEKKTFLKTLRRK